MELSSRTIRWRTSYSAEFYRSPRNGGRLSLVLHLFLILKIYLFIVVMRIKSDDWLYIRLYLQWIVTVLHTRSFICKVKIFLYGVCPMSIVRTVKDVSSHLSLVVRASASWSVFPGWVRPKDFKSWYSQLPCLTFSN